MIPKKTNLSSLLDELWRRPEERTNLITQLVTSLTDADWLILAAWDTAATFGPPRGRLNLMPQLIQVIDNGGKLFLVVSLVKAKEITSSQCLITYVDEDICVIIDKSSPNIPTGQSVHDPKGLLIALQLIRDHLDSALLKPQDLRNAQIARYAALSSLDDDTFRRLATWFPAVESYL
jgi:hypothetical protein